MICRDLFKCYGEQVIDRIELYAVTFLPVTVSANSVALCLFPLLFQAVK